MCAGDFHDDIRIYSRNSAKDFVFQLFDFKSRCNMENGLFMWARLLAMVVQEFVFESFPLPG